VRYASITYAARTILGPALVALLLHWPATAPCAPIEEHQIKAAMLFNMIRFIDWPENGGSNGSKLITICIHGKSPLTDALRKLEGKQIRGKTIAISQARESANYQSCQLLAAGQKDHQLLQAALAQTRSLALLTVGEARGFAESGGVIGLFIRNERVRFEINLAAARRHKLRISSKLLKLADHVYE